MKDKYYTPELKEFRIGFEYEWSCEAMNTPWTKSICDVKMHPLDVDCIRINECRVKYLDKDDIESIEFNGSRFKFIVKTGNGPNESDTYITGNFLIKLNELTHQLSFIEKIILPSPDEHKAVFKEHFDLIVKNKSELKELLTKINIS